MSILGAAHVYLLPLATYYSFSHNIVCIGRGCVNVYSGSIFQKQRSRTGEVQLLYEKITLARLKIRGCIARYPQRSFGKTV